MPKPAFVFVPGSYNLASAYDPIVKAVANAGYEIIGIDLPSVGPGPRQGKNTTAPSMYDDAAAIAAQVEKLADEGQDVVIVGHSYAGVPMSQSTKGLEKSTRKEQGKSGGIVHLGFLSALVPPVGGSAASLLGRFGDEKRPAVSVDANGWMLMEDPARTAAMICQDVPAAEGEAAIRGFSKHSAQSFGNELTHAGYLDVPSSWLLTLKDNAGPPDFQRDMISSIEKGSGRRIDVTEVDSGHMANLSTKKEVIAWILDIAKQHEQES